MSTPSKRHKKKTDDALNDPEVLKDAPCMPVSYSHLHDPGEDDQDGEYEMRQWKAVREAARKKEQEPNG